MEQAAGRGPANHSQELADLETEADMPLEQLLASYGFVMGGRDEAEPADSPAPSSPKRQKVAPHREAVPKEAQMDGQDLDALASSDDDDGEALWLARAHFGHAQPHGPAVPCPPLLLACVYV